MDSVVFDIVDEMLDMDGDVTIAGVTFSRSYILKRLDPIAYRDLCNDTVDSHIQDLQSDLDRLDPELDADEIDAIHVQIAELQDY